MLPSRSPKRAEPDETFDLAHKWLHHGVSHFPNLKSDQKSSVWECVLTARTVSRVSLLETDEIIVKPVEVGRLADLVCEKTVGKGKSWRDAAPRRVFDGHIEPIVIRDRDVNFASGVLTAVAGSEHGAS